jgi:hypothetical protein
MPHDILLFLPLLISLLLNEQLSEQFLSSSGIKFQIENNKTLSQKLSEVNFKTIKLTIINL